MTFEEYFENKHKGLIDETRAEYERVMDPYFIEMGAHYKRINKSGELITPMYYEWGKDKSEHFITWKNVDPNSKDKDVSYGYSNIEAPLMLQKVKLGTGVYPHNTFKTQFHMINGKEIRFWGYVNSHYESKRHSVEWRFWIDGDYHCLRGSSYKSRTLDKKENGCFLYQIEDKDKRTKAVYRDISLRRAKELIFGDPNYKINKHKEEDLIQQLQNQINENS